MLAGVEFADILEEARWNGGPAGGNPSSCGCEKWQRGKVYHGSLGPYDREGVAGFPMQGDGPSPPPRSAVAPFCP